MSEPLILEEEGTGYRFSWGLALAGGIVALAVTFLLLTLGSGVGLWLLRPATANMSVAPGFLTAGAIYFLVAQAFGFAVGGHLAGRLLGPTLETTLQEEVRAAAHGLVAWAVAVLGTVLLLAFAGATLAGLYGAERDARPQSAIPYEVDRLFRPAPTASAANPAPEGNSAIAARAEAARILEAGYARGGLMPLDDRERLTSLISQFSGARQQQAGLRVDATLWRFRTQAAWTANRARKVARNASLWTAASLFFGAVVAMVAAAMARFEDDNETPWTLFAFHRGWRRSG